MRTFSSSRQRRRYSTPKERDRWGRRYGRSGLSQRQFAERQGLSLFTLRRWIAQCSVKNGSRVPAQALWKELKLDGLPGVTYWAAEVVRPDGWTVRVAHHAPANLLAELLRVRSC